MKKRFLLIVAIFILTFVLPTLMIACDPQTPPDGPTDEKVNYSVIVLSPSEDPVANVTVNWLSGTQVVGTAKTDADGTATASLDKGNYTVELEGYAEGLEYTPASVNATMRDIEVQLVVRKITYSVTVKSSSGSPVSNVTVNWLSGSSIVGTVKTDAQGKAAKDLDYGEYTVTLDNLPSGNVYDRLSPVTAANPSTEVTLRSGSTKSYSVTVKSQGGLIFKNQTVSIFIKGEEDDDANVYISGFTNDEGVYSFTIAERNYVVKATDLQAGYTSSSIELTPTNTEGEITLTSAIIDLNEANSVDYYVMGDIFHDYTFTTPYNMADGNPWSSSISEILKTKKAIILNNWGLKCSWCLTEMPDMQELYNNYSDKIEIIAVNNFTGISDSNSQIISHQAQYGYTYPMMRDTYNFTNKFGITGWPLTVVIDRYGAIAHIESGAITSYEEWEHLVLKYIGDDYVQTFTPGDRVSEPIGSELAKPDVTVPEDHYTTQVPGVLHNTATFPANTTITWSAYDNEYAWPFMIGNDATISPDGEYLYASNMGRPNSTAVICANITLSAGKVLTFDYYADSDSNDILYFYWNGKTVLTISGNSNGWKTCYVYSELLDGDYTLQIAYSKDSSGNVGLDNVYLRNLRFVDLSEIENGDESVNMLRGAAYGQPSENDLVFPYYADVALGSDGYYHVNLGTLQNAALAGGDESPLLLLNVSGTTSWSPMYSLSELVTGYSVENTDQYAFSCVFTVNGVTRDYRADLLRYFSVANSSDVPGFIPVNQYLHDMLVGFMRNVSGSDSHINEWLEVCYYYSHYGTGEPIGNPIVGLMTETAIEVTTDTTYTADITHLAIPFPTLIYKFTPDKTALYKIESLIPDVAVNQQYAQVWIYDDNTDPDHALAHSGDERITIDRVNEQNFVLYLTLEANHTYYIELAFTMQQSGTYDFIITEQTTDVTVLEPTSGDTFVYVLDENGEVVKVPGANGEMVEVIELAAPVEYDKDEQGYYHVKNADGTLGEYIYLDVDNCNTMLLGGVSIRDLVDMYVNDPLLNQDGTINYLDYKFFDFRYCVMYYKTTDADGEEIDTYIPKVDITNTDSKYKDYTQILKTYIDKAATEGEMKGLIKVNDEIITILKLYIELRANGVWAKDAQISEWYIDAALENEWLRFCWYFHTYEAYNESENA